MEPGLHGVQHCTVRTMVPKSTDAPDLGHCNLSSEKNAGKWPEDNRPGSGRVLLFQLVPGALDLDLAW
jgi:hypothetical protein